MTEISCFSIKDLGLDLAALGFLVSMAGVVENNLLLNHLAAMIIWCPSNTINTIYFYGRAKDMWDGGLSNWLYCISYAAMLVSGVWGLKQAGVW
jgi:hypothetical protein